MLKRKLMSLIGLAGSALVSQAATAQVTVPPELQKKIATHPHARQLTDWGSRPEWSADSKRLIFVNKEFGDVYELDVATGRTLPLTYGFPHEGILRAYYLMDGNFLLAAPREHTAGLEPYTRILESELWFLRKDLSAPAMPLDLRHAEGVAVARNSMKIAWMAGLQNLPPKPQPKFPGDRPTITTREVVTLMGTVKNPPGGIWTGDIVIENGVAKVVNRKHVVVCQPGSPLYVAIAALGQRCGGTEPQNFVPTDENKLIFTALARDAKRAFIVHTFMVDLRNGQVTKINKDDLHAEAEGVFADGKSTLVEHSAEKDGWLAGQSVDLWQVSLDGSGRMKPVTQYHAIDPELKSNQGVISPDGRWMAYTVATKSIEKIVPGQGIGIFLLDLKAAGF